jgi:hypothetical protein
LRIRIFKKAHVLPPWKTKSTFPTRPPTSNASHRTNSEQFKFILAYERLQSRVTLTQLQMIIRNKCNFFFPWRKSLSLSRFHDYTQTHHTRLGHLWTSDQPDAETST